MSLTLENFIPVLLLKLADNKFEHRNYSDQHTKISRKDLLKKYNYSLDSLVIDIVKNFNKKMGSLSDKEDMRKLMDTILNSKDEDEIEDAQTEFENEVFNLFIETTEFYQINSLHGDHRFEIEKRLFDVMKNDETYNHITKYFYQSKE